MLLLWNTTQLSWQAGVVLVKAAIKRVTITPEDRQEETVGNTSGLATMYVLVSSVPCAVELGIDAAKVRATRLLPLACRLVATFQVTV